MINLINVIGQLQDERTRIAKELERLDAALAALNGSNGQRSSSRGPLSGAARARIAAAQRARWAKLRANANPKADIRATRKRTLSPAGRKRIAAAQRARWAKVRTAKAKRVAA